MKKVFISYSHKDKDWVRSWLLPKLENHGIETHIDYRDFEIGVPSLVNMERAVEKCAKTILVLTPNWVESEWARFEGLMLQTEDPIGLRGRILPLMLADCELPLRLKIFTYANFRDESNWDFEFERLVKQIKKDFAEVEELPAELPALGDENIHISGLPETGYELYGRQKELKILNEAWESAGTNVLSFVAYGGVGKSTLVNKWLEKMRWDNYRGAQRVYAWSFYSQGTGERITSADVFVNESLHWFGDSKMADSERSPWDKGKRLAELVQEKKTLLILDGMEPLQSSYKHDKGEVKDAALGVLLRELAKKNCGLCVITTREELRGIRRGADSILQKNLNQISEEAGRALLRVAGIRGTDAELEEVTRDFGNHALAVSLLAAYLQDFPGKHVSNARLIPDLDIAVKDGKHPRRVMEVLAKRFGDSPELNVLYMIGLFDRPATEKEIRWLRTREEVPDLTDRIRWLDEEDWNRVVANLRRLRLIAPESHHNWGGLDAHPHVREHFGQKLKETNEESWKLGHSHLYEFLKMSAPRLPETLEEMRPLFLAVSHSCLAGRHQEALDEVFYARMDRGEGFVGHKLGAMGAVLAALSGFFAVRWSQLTGGLRKRCRGYVLNVTGFCLRALGRLTEAAEPMEAGMEASIAEEDWRGAAQDAGNLSELYLTLGDVKKAVDYARQSVGYGDRSGEWFRKAVDRTRVANALHQAGDVEESKELFEKAEEIQKENQQEYAYLYSQRGFHFCDLLLSGGQYKEVQERATKAVDIAQLSRRLLDIALDKLSLGRAYLLEAIAEKTGAFSKAADFLNQAVDGIREAGTQYHLPRGLLARAELYRYQRSWDKAWGDLEEAAEIAERGQMGLHLADYHLESARLCLAQGRGPDGREHWKEAKDRIEKMGYHRRDPEVMLIEAELELVEGKKTKAKQTLKKAKECIDKMAFHRWDIELEELQGRLK